MRPLRAIVLAAGQGIRLRTLVVDRPKGLIEIGGEALVARSLRCLRGAGIAQATIVVGYCAEQYRDRWGRDADVTIVENDVYASSGSMASLALALDAWPDEEVLVLESDIIYEPRALSAVLSSASATATLVSGPTRAGDEVWVDAADGRLRAMSKDRHQLQSIVGEFVGITRLSRATARAMRDTFRQFVEVHGHARMDYETGALAAIAGRHPVGVVCVPDLQWGEIDDERHYARVASMRW